MASRIERAAGGKLAGKTAGHRIAVVGKVAEQIGGHISDLPLPNAVDDRLLQRVAVEREEEEADAGPAVGRLVGREDAFEARLGVAADDAGRVARGSLARR
jgi:hypothetical protein